MPGEGNLTSGAVYGRQYDLSVGTAFLVLALLGTVGNSLTLVVIGRTRRLYNHCTPFLCR